MNLRKDNTCLAGFLDDVDLAVVLDSHDEGQRGANVHRLKRDLRQLAPPSILRNEKLSKE